MNNITTTHITFVYIELY